MKIRYTFYGKPGSAGSNLKVYMEIAVKEKINQKILNEAFSRFGLETSPFTALDGFENFIYEVQAEQGSLIIRLSHSSKRTEQAVASELAYLQYLARNMANVSLPVLSLAKNLIESISDEAGGYFYAVCFEKAPGSHPQEKMYTENFHYIWGKAMGRMHQLSTSYQPVNGLERIHWFDEVEVTQPEKYVPSDQWSLLEKYQQTISRLRTLPVSPSTYGVIHNDLHPYNFLVDGGQITMIDFEDAVQMWYVSDIAASLFMTSIWPPNGLTPDQYALSFLPPFLKGYNTEKRLHPTCLYRLPLFLKFREISQYVAMYRAADLDDMDPWVARFMNGRRERIENDVPVFNIQNWDQFL